nr:PKD domain-containing protein [Haliscomenobacter sp.]
RYTVTLNIVNQCGNSIDQSEISVFPLPKARIGLDSLSNQCSPVEATITNRSTGSPDACFWDFGNGITDNTCRNIYVQRYSADTTTLEYLIKLQVSNACGISRDSFPLTVTSPGVRTFFSLDDYNICPNKPIQFRDASTPLPTRVFWKFGDGGASQERNPTYIYRDSDTTLTVTLVSITGCGYDSLSRKINIYPLPDVNFATDRYACAQQPTTFINRSNERAAFRWDFGDGQIDSVSYSPQHRYQNGGMMANVSLTIRDFPNGCENTITKSLLIRSRPEAMFQINGDSTGCAPFSVLLQNLSRNSNRWEWDFGDGKTSTLENPGTVYDTGAYDITLIASYEGVCLDTFRLDDAVNADDCGAFIPNAFSPNNDGLNDYFTVYGGPFSATKILTLRIYTRWGEMVFEKENFDMDNLSGWDGRIDGQTPIPGVYVYWVEIEQLGGRRKTYKGDVTLVR